MWQIENTEIILQQGDITNFEGDALVNAANTRLILGAGVAGAIKKKGGPSIQEECNNIGSIELGEAAITNGGSLNVKYVIHGASMHLGGRTTEISLGETIWNCLLRGREKNIETIAFPAIGTGIAGFPLEKCASIMLKEIDKFLMSEEHNFKSITIYLFSEKDYYKFKMIFKEYYCIVDA